MLCDRRNCSCLYITAPKTARSLRSPTKMTQQAQPPPRSRSPRLEDFPRPGNPFRRRQQQKLSVISQQHQQQPPTSVSHPIIHSSNNNNNKKPAGSLSSEAPEVCAPPPEPARTPRYVGGLGHTWPRLMMIEICTKSLISRPFFGEETQTAHRSEFPSRRRGWRQHPDLPDKEVQRHLAGERRLEAPSGAAASDGPGEAHRRVYFAI